MQLGPVTDVTALEDDGVGAVNKVLGFGNEAQIGDDDSGAFGGGLAAELQSDP